MCDCKSNKPTISFNLPIPKTTWSNLLISEGLVPLQIISPVERPWNYMQHTHTYTQMIYLYWEIGTIKTKQIMKQKQIEENMF